jgi:hypothetical protein
MLRSQVPIVYEKQRKNYDFINVWHKKKVIVNDKTKREMRKTKDVMRILGVSSPCLTRREFAFLVSQDLHLRPQSVTPAWM